MAASGIETHKIFNDPIHGHIALPQLCVQIIDTPVFQRLRNIKQLGATYKVYPGASHNRFEHSLGVCHLAGKFVERLRTVQRELFEARQELKNQDDFEISDKDVLCLQVAGLCHDLGHGPLSHVFETYFIQKIASRDADSKDKKWTHETATHKLLDHLWEVPEGVFKRGSVMLGKKDIEFIKELIHKSKKLVIVNGETQAIPLNADERENLTGRSRKKDFLYEIISNDENSIDVDKWDYFARDCFHLGFKNNFDHNRLIQFSRLIEVDEGASGKRWHICYREKEVENLYHMFYSRVILHKRACLHKTTKIIEIMYMEALEKVNPYFRIKGTNDDPKKISECTDDQVAYSRLTDNIFDMVRYRYQYMVQPRKENKGTQAPDDDSKETQAIQQAIQVPDDDSKETQAIQQALQIPDADSKETQAIQQALQILDDIEDRKLYKFVGEAIPEGGRKYDKNNLREEELAIKVQIGLLEIGNSKLDPEDFLINILEFSYGGTDNPVNKVFFYVKSDPETAIPLERKEVSFLLPTVYCEQVVRMYSRKLDEDKVKQCLDYFEQWCKDKKMNGKWKFYAKARAASHKRQQEFPDLSDKRAKEDT